MTSDKRSASYGLHVAGEKRFIRNWMRATFYGWAIGFVLVLVLIAITGVIGLGETQFAVGLGMGAGVDWFQGRILAPAAEPAFHKRVLQT